MKIDAGNLFLRWRRRPSKISERTLKNSEIIARALKPLAYDAVAVSVNDAALGIKGLNKLATLMGAPFISANLVHEKTGKLVWPNALTKDIAGIRFGIFAVAAPQNEKLPNALKENRLRFTDPKKAAQDAINTLRKNGAKIVVGLLSMPNSDAQQLADKIKGMDFAIMGQSYRSHGGVVTKGQANLLEVGYRGKALGVLSLRIVGTDLTFVNAGKRDNIKEKIADMDNRINRYVQVLSRMPSNKPQSERYQKIYQNIVKNLKAQRAVAVKELLKTGTAPANKSAYANRSFILTKSIKPNKEVQDIIANFRKANNLKGPGKIRTLKLGKDFRVIMNRGNKKKPGAKSLKK